MPHCYHRVVVLLALMLLAAAALPFVNFAPNRLLSGDGLWLWQIWSFPPLALLLVPLLFVLLSFFPGRLANLLILLLAQGGFTLLLWLSGEAANRLAETTTPLARTSPGSGLWLSLLLMLLIASEAIRRLTPHVLWRWLLNVQLWLIPCW